MKRTAALLFCILSLTAILLSACTTENENRMTSSELAQSWQQNGYPDDVGGIYHTISGYTIILTDPTAGRTAAIKKQVTDPGRICFVSGRYSYNEMAAALSEISKDLSAGDGIYSVFIEEAYNCLIVDVREDMLESAAAEYENKYGQMVRVRTGHTVRDIAVIIREPRTLIILSAMILLIALLVISSSITNSTRR